jgi:hypothetical protein
MALPAAEWQWQIHISGLGSFLSVVGVMATLLIFYGFVHPA